MGPRERGQRAASPVPEAQREVIAVVGHGMVGHRFCETLFRLGGAERFLVVVFGEEPERAYDRVHLSQVLEGKPPTFLYEPSLYEKNGAKVRLGEKVESIDLKAKEIRTASTSVAFDKLVLATGSSPVLPKIPGIDAEGVTCYRDVRDAQRIRELGLKVAKAGSTAVVIGAGLLGIEAGDALRALGCRVILVESAGHLLPRQLDQHAADLLAKAITRAEVGIRTGKRVSRIERVDSDSFRVELGDGEVLEAAMVVVAAGVRARDELAREAGLNCDLFGGVEVNDGLATSMESVFAIGECARHAGVCYGLVAPGNEMADALARRLLGQKAAFKGAELSTRLKVSHVDLTVMGQSNVRDLSTEYVRRETEQTLQQLVLRKGRLVGLSVIGEWPEIHAAQGAIATQQRISARRLKAFGEGKPLFRSGTVNLRVWPETATVCNCMGVSCGAVRQAFDAGKTTVEELVEATGAGSVCGTCRPLLASLKTGSAKIGVASTRSDVFAFLALVLVLVILVAPSMPYATSVVEPTVWDPLGRSDLIKQLTGFSILGLASFGLLISLHKRLSWLRRLGHAALRSLHIALGAGCAAVFVAHTGLRLGNNLDFVLASFFLATLVLGATAALVPRLTQSRANWGRIKSTLERIHLYVVWPLPALVLLHVLKVYFF